MTYYSCLLHYNIYQEVKILTVYIDVLIVLNIYVNYFLLRTTAKLTHSPLGIIRCIAASFYGSLFSLLILAPELPLAVTLAVKSAAAVTIVIAAFVVHGMRMLLKNTAAFFLSNFVFAGMIYAVYLWLRPEFMHFSNTYFYIDFSLLLLVITTAVLYGAVCLIKRFTDISPPENTHVLIRSGSSIIRITGLADTGNALIDCFSGKPVVICGKNDIGEVKTRIRLIPCSTVSDNGVMPVFRPDEVIIVDDQTGERKCVDVMIGIGESSGKAIFNPKILKM